MTKEEIYIKYKKKGLLNHIKSYNQDVPVSCQFQVDERDFDIERTLCSMSRCENCGSCCQTFPCVFSPKDFLDLENLDYMRRILNTGLLCISELYNTSILLIRPRGRGDLGIFSPLDEIRYTYDGANPCILLSQGCMLSSLYKPSQGLLYIPTTFSHRVIYSDGAIKKEYEPYQEILYVLLEEYGNVIKYPNVTKENINVLKKFIAGYKK